MSPAQKIRGETSDGVQSGRGTLGYMFTSPRNTLDKPPLQKGNSYKSAVFDRISTTNEKSSKVEHNALITEINRWSRTFKGQAL